MKKWIGSLVLAGLASVVLAQAPFTIFRPADGAKVRETVHVLIPKGSIPPGGYIGVFLGGKFLEATVPPLKGKFYDYALNTKALGLEDTPPGKPLKLELVLYVDYQEKSRIVDRTNIDINIGNEANIPIPNDGVKLRYTFVPGTRMIYRLDQQTSVSPISSLENDKGGRAAEIDGDVETIRLAYEVMNSYGDGDGLLRMQPIPPKGQDFSLFTTDGQNEEKWFDYEMAPVYMRIKSTGQEVFGSVPFYTPLEGTSGDAVNNNLLAAYPLPTLPTKPVHVGDSWQSQFQQDSIDMTNLPEDESLVETSIARGEFIDTEWEGGHPCAKIRHVIEAGATTKKGQKLKAQGAEFGDDKISLQETIWFDLDHHKVIKIVRDQTIDRKVQAQATGGGGGMPGAPGGMGAAGPKGKPGITLGGMGITLPTPMLQQGKQRRPPPGAGNGGGPRGPGGMVGPGGMGGPGGFPGRGGGTSAPAAPTYIRIRSVQTFTLES